MVQERNKTSCANKQAIIMRSFSFGDTIDLAQCILRFCKRKDDGYRTVFIIREQAMQRLIKQPTRIT